ncbi:hypothetical protein [Kordia sp.]|uniref:hypothetical protein n=1 Tax=Kordia sp. TaxID=1965332 RepID=UPI003D2A3A65
MKNIFSFFLLFCTIISYSQKNSEYDIHISLDDYKKSIIVENDTITHQTIRLRNQKKDQKSYIINDKGELIFNIKIKSSNSINFIDLEYTNIKNNNLPILKKSSKISNILNYPSDFIVNDLESIFNILEKAKNIYIIEENDIVGYDVLKKVVLKEYARL